MQSVRHCAVFQRLFVLLLANSIRCAISPPVHDAASLVYLDRMISVCRRSIDGNISFYDEPPPELHRIDAIRIPHDVDLNGTLPLICNPLPLIRPTTTEDYGNDGSAFKRISCALTGSPRLQSSATYWCTSNATQNGTTFTAFEALGTPIEIDILRQPHCIGFASTINDSTSRRATVATLDCDGINGTLIIIRNERYNSEDSDDSESGQHASHWRYHSPRPKKRRHTVWIPRSIWSSNRNSSCFVNLVVFGLLFVLIGVSVVLVSLF